MSHEKCPRVSCNITQYAKPVKNISTDDATARASHTDTDNVLKTRSDRPTQHKKKKQLNYYYYYTTFIVQYSLMTIWRIHRKIVHKNSRIPKGDHCSLFTAFLLAFPLYNLLLLIYHSIFTRVTAERGSGLLKYIVFQYQYYLFQLFVNANICKLRSLQSEGIYLDEVTNFVFFVFRRLVNSQKLIHTYIYAAYMHNILYLHTGKMKYRQCNGPTGSCVERVHETRGFYNNNSKSPKKGKQEIM